LKKSGIEETDPGDPRAQILAGARKSIQDAYGLPSLQKPSGGFGYWSGTQEDVALTAYILRLLSEASGFIEVDPDVTSKARAYLIKQQAQTGAWTRYDWSTARQKDNPQETAYVVRALATSSGSPEKVVPFGWISEAATGFCFASAEIVIWSADTTDTSPGKFLLGSLIAALRTSVNTRSRHAVTNA